ncbi:flavoprotein [Streptomyces sp. Ru73]|uniref:flavoprotein n=1 Tax=Streptomyces sp. Ru73 TaxID=2080748 RepID=UPI000CDD879F|nr:flavoprotein [Streptomyces sp. Ru73]POX40705.1 flavoprotein [Streptomyces sp. Ru73]
MGTGTGTPVSRETRTGTGTDRKPFLYVVLCAAGIANDVGKLIRNAQQRTWRVGVIATPRGRECVDTAAIEALTGYPVRSAWRVPGEPRPLPPADAIAVAPATFNTINKWAQGIADTLALGILCEAHGFGTPTAALPYLNAAQAAHPAYAQSLARLRRMGVLLGDYVPHPPRTGGGRRRFRWEQALDLLAPVLERR